MKKGKLFLKIAGGIIILAIIIIVGFYSSQREDKAEEVNVITEKTEYQVGESLKVKIENNLKAGICLSSCYPYYLEKRDGNWDSYHYQNCPNSNTVEKCINSRETKAFEIIIPPVKTGLHRLALPACLSCNLQEKFREEKWLYSNDFVINE